MKIIDDKRGVASENMTLVFNTTQQGIWNKLGWDQSAGFEL